MKTVFQYQDQYAGFICEVTRYIEEIRSQVYIFQHEQTQSKVIAVKNHDPNKTFTIGFQTIPEDSTGVAHIIEHTVLSGSRKFPLKNLFEELSKRGLMTFLNAMTASDMTLYPFASRNEKEYFNLMDVYLDVTLYPLLDEHSFLQEGWRLELLSPDEFPKYKGIVYNEMKGVYSNPLYHVRNAVFKSLMPGSTYACDSGGNPENIVDLTYEQFRDFHQTFYHPSNAVIGLYGDADLKKELDFLNDQYLSHFQYQPSVRKLNLGESPAEPVQSETTYGVTPNAREDAMTYLTIASSVADSTNQVQNTAFDIIASILFYSEASPLKNALLEAGIGKDVAGTYHDSAYVSTMITSLIGTKKEHTARFEQIYRDVLTHIRESGFDPDLLNSELNAYEFSRREEANESQRGLNYHYQAIRALFYDLDPIRELQFQAVMTEIRDKAVHSRYLEQLIGDFLLTNPKTALIATLPDEHKLEKAQTNRLEKLKKIKAQMSADQIRTLIADSNRLLEKQQEPATPEQLGTLPSLTRHDLPEKITTPVPEMTTIANRPALFWNRYANDISYIQLGFDLSHLDPELLPYLKIFSGLVTEIGTNQINYTDLAKSLAAYTGGFNSVFSCHVKRGQPDQFRPMLWFSFKALRQYLPQAVHLISDVLRNVSFSDHKRIRQIVERDFAWIHQEIHTSGMYLPRLRINSFQDQSGIFNEKVNGYNSYLTLKALAQNYEMHEELFLEKMESLKQQIFTRHNVTLSATGGQQDLKLIHSLGGDLIQNLSDRLPDEAEHSLSPILGHHSAFCTSAEVVYAMQGGNIYQAGMPYSGVLEVLTSVLTRSYLLNHIRMQGGAYGTWIQLDANSGSFIVTSYRDPNVRKTFEVYDNIPDYVSSLQMSREELEQWIIRTYGAFDPLLSPEQEGIFARNLMLSGVTSDLRNQILQEIESTTKSDLQGYAEGFRDLIAQSYRSIIGSRDLIMADQDLFDEIIEV